MRRVPPFPREGVFAQLLIAEAQLLVEGPAIVQWTDSHSPNMASYAFRNKRFRF